MYSGNFEIANLCVNREYDQTSKNNMGRNPLGEAQTLGNHDIAQLLRLSQIKGNIGERIKERANSINKGNGCIKNIMDELSRIGEQTASIFKKTMVEIVTSLIQQKLYFTLFLSQISCYLCVN